MATVIVINPNETDPYVRILSALKNKAPTLRAIGALMEAESQRSFGQQRFGRFRWAEQYPNSGAPFVHIAGLVSDFNDGRTSPKARRLSRQRPLRETGKLQGSIRSAIVKKDTVAVGTNVPYASLHQWGGVSTQPLTKPTKKRIAKWLLKQDKLMQRKLSFLTMPNNTSHDTEVEQRPFLGVSARLSRKIKATVERGVASTRSELAAQLRAARMGRSAGRKRG